MFTKIKLRDQFISLFVIVLLAMTFMGVAGVYSLSSVNARLTDAQEMSTKIIDSINLARKAQVEFKKQVQEWKNILLRGNDPELFNKYHNEFNKEQDSVRQDLTRLIGLMKELKINPALAEDSQKKLAELGTKYEDALKSYDQKNPQSSHIVDNLVKGIDRAPTDAIDNTVAFIWTEGQKRLETVKQESTETHKLQKRLIIGISFMAILAIGVIMVVILKSVLQKLNEMVEKISEIAKGDFTQKVPVRSNDELGVLGESVNTMVSGLRAMFMEIRQNSGTLAASAEELSAVSTQLSASSEEMSRQSAGVAGATEQMSANIGSMAAAVEEASVNATTVSGTAEQMSANMHSIASSVEKMSQSIHEVAKGAGETSKVAGEAMGLSRSASETMQTLGAAANEIGKVTEMIKRIAEQTNLLALNATIEAASAGEAGRGFAVVANEIKELAHQSARAAEEIATKINGVRGSAASAVKVIADVSDIIGKINTSVGSISTAVNQQTAAANEISRNVSEVSKGAVDIASSIAEVAKGTTEISRNSGEAARGANEVSSNIQGISKAVQDNNSGIRQINSSSGELAKISAGMQEHLAQFRLEIESPGNGGSGHKRMGIIPAGLRR